MVAFMWRVRCNHKTHGPMESCLYNKYIIWTWSIGPGSQLLHLYFRDHTCCTRYPLGGNNLWLPVSEQKWCPNLLSLWAWLRAWSHALSICGLWMFVHPVDASPCNVIEKCDFAFSQKRRLLPTCHWKWVRKKALQGYRGVFMQEGFQIKYWGMVAEKHLLWRLMVFHT